MNEEGARPQDLRSKNCRKMLHILSGAENLTINEIVSKMHLSRTAVQNILQRLLKDGMIVEGQKRNSTRLGGKRAASYSICPDYKYSIFIYLNTGSVIAELNNFALKRLDFRTADLSHSDYPEVIDIIADLAKQLLKDARIDASRLYGIAISVSGMVDTERGILLELTGKDTHSRWGSNRSLAEDLQARLGFRSDIYIDNMCNFSGYASFLSITGGEAESCVYLLAHSCGIGAAYIKNGRIQRGVHGLLGEIGHVTVDFGSPYRCRCGRTGCFEAFLYPENIRDRANTAIRKGLAPQLSPDEIASVDDLLTAANRLDSYGLEQIDSLGEYFAKLFYNIQLMMDPECIIFHDSFSVQAAALHTSMEKACSREQSVYLKVPISILFDDALFTERVRIGAAFCLRNRFLDRNMKENLDTV